MAAPVVVERLQVVARIVVPGSGHKQGSWTKGSSCRMRLGEIECFASKSSLLGASGTWKPVIIGTSFFNLI
jgi:hypothetical protein